MHMLSYLCRMGFRISWKTVCVGLFGCDEIPVSLSHEEAVDYLYGLLETVNNRTDDIVTLICETDDRERFDKCLKALADKDGADLLLQKRKWRAGLLGALLDGIDSRPLWGLPEITEFWATVGNKACGPCAFPENREDLYQFFSEESYRSILEKNRDFLKKETAEIIRAEEN